MSTDPAWRSCTTACNGVKFAGTPQCQGEVHAATPVGQLAPRMCRRELYTAEGLIVCSGRLEGHDGRCGPAPPTIFVGVPA